MFTTHPLKDGQDSRGRTFKFACDIVKLCGQLYDGGGMGRVLASQLVRCGTSVTSMLEEAKAAESRRDFISKCSIALKEGREAHVRLRILLASRIGSAYEIQELIAEAHEITSIAAAIIRNTRRRQLGEAAGALAFLLAVFILNFAF